MTVNAASAVTNATSPASSLTMQDFLKVLLTQLTYQDPLKPMDNQEFMAHIAQFTSLQQTAELNGNVQLLIANQAALQSVGLLGRTVDVATSSGTVTGTVTALSFAGATPQVTVTTAQGTSLSGVDLAAVTAVR
jgi:flagellar basal-body rod modification protein FlgD